MGGRGRTEKEPKEGRWVWLQEVSPARLSAYERMLESGGKVVRVDGAERVGWQQEAFRWAIGEERKRRGGAGGE